MDEKQSGRYYITVLALITAASLYPVYMGISVIIETLRGGAVPIERYPKYVIPYTPIAISLLAGAALLPLLRRLGRALSFPCGAACSAAVFCISERIFEKKVLVSATELIPLESWQMSLCYIPPEQYRTRTWEAVDILLGGYSPSFKLHFYLISAVIILSLLRCVYGFAETRPPEREGKALVSLLVSGLAFLGVCVWACFTAFYRTGEMTVSPLSAALMSVFFVIMGVVAGLFVLSFTAVSGNRSLRVVLPAAVSAAAVISMYIGEMKLLSGNLYRFGSGFMFEGLGRLTLAPADILIIILSGAVTALVCAACGAPSQEADA